MFPAAEVNSVTGAFWLFRPVLPDLTDKKKHDYCLDPLITKKVAQFLQKELIWRIQPNFPEVETKLKTFSESWPPFFNKLPIWVEIMSYFFLIWIFKTIYLCLLCNNYLYGVPEGQNTRNFFGKSPNLWSEMFCLPNFSPPNVVFCPKFYFVSSKCFCFFLKY